MIENLVLNLTTKKQGKSLHAAHAFAVLKSCLSTHGPESKF